MRAPQTGLLDLVLAGPGADPARLAELRRVAAEFNLDTNNLPTHPVVRHGDVWLCDRHRVACGDATNAIDVACAMGDLQPNLMVTDPPYGVEYDPNWRNSLEAWKAPRSVGSVINDTRADWKSAWLLHPGDVVYIWHADKYASDVQQSLRESGFEIRSQIVWVKQHFVIGRGNYHWQHEPCWYAVRLGKTANWCGDHKQATIWHIKNASSMGGDRSDGIFGHGTQKPLECMRRPIANHDAPCVYDPFLGSGTTLIAAELEDRTCVGVELNPLYVYIAVDRWQKTVGQRAVLESTGETLTEVDERRKRDPEAAEPIIKTAPRIAPVTFIAPKQRPMVAEPPAPAGVPSGLFDLYAENTAPGPNTSRTAAMIAGAGVTHTGGDLCAPAAAYTLLGAEPVTLAPRQSPAARRTLTATTITVRAADVVTLAPRGAQRVPIGFAAPPRETPSDPFLAHHAKRLRMAGAAPIQFDEWDHDRAAVGFDCEVYPNFCVVCFKRFSDGCRAAFEMSPRVPALNVDGVRAILRGNTVVSFNGSSYDEHILAAALEGADCRRLFELSQAIVVRNERPRGRPFSPPLNHVDLLGVLPQGRRSLKEIHGRLHGRFLVDLPYPPGTELTPHQMNVVTLYCMNDLDALDGLRSALLGPLEMRAEMGSRLNIDLRSLSDAQVGEAVVRAMLHGTPRLPEAVDETFGYNPPPFIRFETDGLRGILGRLSGATFAADAGGNVMPPDWLRGLTVTVGGTDYQMGVGGLHSQEAHRALRSDDERFLLDVDVGSQYPLIILRNGICPPAAGPEFLGVYEGLIRERLEAKAAGDRVRADGLKIAVNGVFGKLGSPYSFIYAPSALTATTLTGQLLVLMLVERAELAGIAVVSANTDGVVFHSPRDRADALDGVLTGWEADAGMVLERTRYDALYSSSVNTYIALKEGGAAKRKGWVANPWAEGDLRGMLSKNPQMTILSDAALALLANGTPVEETIAASADPRAFVTLIKVASGGSWRNQPLGRAARWYWSTDGDAIVYTDSGRRVAKTEGAAPMMEMIDRVPADLDRAKYVAEAHRLLVDLGAEHAPGLL